MNHRMNSIETLQKLADILSQSLILRHASYNYGDGPFQGRFTKSVESCTHAAIQIHCPNEPEQVQEIFQDICTDLIEHDPEKAQYLAEKIDRDCLYLAMQLKRTKQ